MPALVRAARPQDVAAITALVAEYAARGDVLPRPADAIRITLANWVVGEHDGQVVACGAIAPYNSSLAEVRTTIVRDGLQGLGVGKQIVAALAELAQARGIPTLFTLTRAVPFFEKLGFSLASREDFPEKVWKDCHGCPLIDACDETALRLDVASFLAETGPSRESADRASDGKPRQSLDGLRPERIIAGSAAISAHDEPAGPNIPPATVVPPSATFSSRTTAARKGHPAPGGNPMSESNAISKVVLAYSGGLDTSVIVPWLRENYGCDVICFCADLGQGEELAGLREKAIASGASEVIVEDLRDEFAEDFLFPMMHSGAVYERQYLLGTSIARPLIAKWQVAVAREYGAEAVAHGCTGKGNDQVRFELTYQALDPTLQVIAPWREWHIRSREDALAYADAHGVPIEGREKSIYSRDRNLWHISHEGGILENPANAPAEDMFMLTTDPRLAPDEPELVEIGFRAGVPITVNGEALGPAALIEKLNAIASPHGVGRIDIVENRLVGMKSRGVYETPGGTLLYAAHRELESLCLDRETAHFKEQMALRYAELVYFGQWYHTLRESLQAFISETQRTVTGWVRLKLYKGSVIVDGRYSPYSLYREDFATFGEDDVYDQSDAAGFIRLFGLQMKVQAMMDVSDGGKTRYAAPDYSKFKRD
jgi:argininosuccinate synthase